MSWPGDAIRKLNVASELERGTVSRAVAESITIS